MPERLVSDLEEKWISVFSCDREQSHSDVSGIAVANAIIEGIMAVG